MVVARSSNSTQCEEEEEWGVKAMKDKDRDKREMRQKKIRMSKPGARGEGVKGKDVKEQGKGVEKET